MKFFKLTNIYVAALAAAAPALVFAQESSDLGVISVKSAPLGGGMMIQDDTPKGRSTVTKDAMDKMAPTMNALEKMKYVPGININSNDITGASGFDITMRGMAADQIGLSVDGIPMNDSGNFALYPNQLGDPENIEMGFATQGTSESDAPHLGASGGNIGFSTVRPEKERSLMYRQSFGSNDLMKEFVRINTGTYNGFGAWVSASHTEASKWKGEGRIQRDMFEMNALYDDGNGNSTNFIAKYSRQKNHNYNIVSKADFAKYGRKYDYPTKPTYNKGNVDASYKTFLNPFENVELSLKQKVRLADTLRWEVTPYYWWGNGGGFSSARTAFLSPNFKTAMNYDLSNLPKNGRTFYRPSWTQTWRPGITTRLDWDMTPDNRLSVGYLYERARQLQTQPYISIDNVSGRPDQIWGQAGKSDKFRDALGRVVQGRDQYTITPLQKAWLEDNWYILPELQITAGIEYSWAERKGKINGSQYDKPSDGYKKRSYHKWLPKASVSYQINDNNQIFYNLSRNLKVPPNYVLYNGGDSIDTEPETSWNHEIGWRYSDEDMLISATLYYLKYDNRIISSQDEEGNFEMMNLGKVENKGIELEWSGNLPYHFNYYASYSYNRNKQKDDILYQGTWLPTTGKTVPNAPRHIGNISLGYDDGRIWGNIAGKFVSKQWGDNTNDESIPGHSLWDLNLGLRFDVDKSVFQEAGVSLSVNNLFDKKYLSSARSIKFSTKKYGTAKPGTVLYNVGEERTIVASFNAKF